MTVDLKLSVSSEWLEGFLQQRLLLWGGAQTAAFLTCPQLIQCLWSTLWEAWTKKTWEESMQSEREKEILSKRQFEQKFEFLHWGVAISLGPEKTKEKSHLGFLALPKLWEPTEKAMGLPKLLSNGSISSQVYIQHISNHSKRKGRCPILSHFGPHSISLYSNVFHPFTF